MCVYVFAYVCLCTTICVPSGFAGKKRTLNPVKPELTEIVCHH